MGDPSTSARHRLGAARLVGAGGVAVLAQFAVHMPEGYFGPSDRMTTFGAAYALAVGALVAMGVWAHLREKRRADDFTPVLVALNVGAFVPALASDPVVAATVIAWHAPLLAAWLFRPTSGAGPSRATPPELDALGTWLALNGPAMRHMTMASLFATIALVGYRIGARVPAQVVCLVLAFLVISLSAPLFLLLLRQGKRGPFFGVPFLVGAVATYDQPDLALSFLAGYQAVALTLVTLHTPVFSELLGYFSRKPARLVVASFAGVIALGTLFLSFPASAASGKSVSPIDALFTATSATCVTGLTVLDTPKDFSGFGQLVILLLIQIGGLNIMVLSTFASMLLIERGLGIRVEKVLAETLDVPQIGSASQLVTFIVLSTLFVEGVGAVLLAYAYLVRGYETLSATWHGVFHAISAFCNAGFALQSDNLVMFQTDPFVLGIVAALITLGGLGFVVLSSVWARLTGRRRQPLAVHTRLVLSTSGVLVAGGAVAYAAVEWGHSLTHLSSVDKVANAVFQVVTPRTAGFNSVDFGLLHPVSVLLLIVLMFIGASPGGTGGGIKTTTTVVLLGAISAIARRERRVVLFRHALPLETIYRSAAITVIAMLAVLGGLAALLATHDLPFHVLLFEVVSALGTVGLSLGATTQLNVFGKLVIVAIMFLGRIGPLTLALLLGREERTRISYPEARIMLG